METKFTKGEWKISMSGAFVEVENHAIASISMINEEGLANAKLIAAAPDLLETLQKCAAYIFRNCNGDYENTPWREAVNAIKKAIE